MKQGYCSVCLGMDDKVSDCEHCLGTGVEPTLGQLLGRTGGQATLQKHGKEHFSKIAKGWPKGKKRKIIE